MFLLIFKALSLSPLFRSSDHPPCSPDDRPRAVPYPCYKCITHIVYPRCTFVFIHIFVLAFFFVAISILRSPDHPPCSPDDRPSAVHKSLPLVVYQPTSHQDAFKESFFDYDTHIGNIDRGTMWHACISKTYIFILRNLLQTFTSLSSPKLYSWY